MGLSDWCHLDDLPVEQFHPIVLVEHAQLAEFVVHLDREETWEQASRHLHNMDPANWAGQFVPKPAAFGYQFDAADGKETRTQSIGREQE